MFNHYSITKHAVNESFNQSLWQARKSALISKVLGKSSSLKSYENVDADVKWQRSYLGLMTIPTGQITGTVGRHDDFDGRFRPLKSYLKERWVNIALRSRDAGWPPIEVIKVGTDYFVVDGHHRTSFAYSTGMAFMDAEVWEIVQEPVTKQIQNNPAPIKYVPQPAPVCGTLAQESICCC